MSRGFVKEDDQEDIPLVPRRADLPEGVTNFVTREGMNQLLAERLDLIREKEAITGTNENERRIALNFINAKLQQLDNRIAEAQIIEANDQPKDEVRFGASVTIKSEKTDTLKAFRIVGVDEADISGGKYHLCHLWLKC